MMRRRGAVLALLLLGAAAPPRTLPAPAGFGELGHERSSARAGAASARIDVWRLKRTSGQPGAVDLVAVSVPSAGRSVKVAPVLKSGASGALFRQGPCPGALVAVNGSFYLRDERGARPLGLVRAEGRTQSAASSRRSGGFLLSDGAGLSITGRAGREAASAARYALESTPILIRAERDDMRGDDGIRFDRVAVGVQRSGAVLIVGAFGASQNGVTLVEFGRLADAAGRVASDPVVDLLAMDGGPSAHIHLPGSGRLFGHKGPAYLPNIVCVGGR